MRRDRRSLPYFPVISPSSSPMTARCRRGLRDEDVRALLRLAQPESRAADDDLDLVGDVVPHHLTDVESARYAVDERQHVDAEGVLQLRVLVEIVEHDLADRVALEHDDE